MGDEITSADLLLMLKTIARAERERRRFIIGIVVLVAYILAVSAWSLFRHHHEPRWMDFLALGIWLIAIQFLRRSTKLYKKVVNHGAELTARKGFFRSF